MEIRFKLSEDNEKDRQIIKMLESEYLQPTQVIKSILYSLAIGKETNILHKSGVNGSNTPNNSIEVENKWSNEKIENSKTLHRSGVNGSDTPNNSIETDDEWSKYFS
nr:MAG TPA: hypothetical protein [Caudoviricetes sp.]